MKSSYKLFGLYWDGINVNNISFKMVENFNEKCDYFSFKKLLCVKDNSDFVKLIDSIKKENIAVIEIDYWTSTTNKIIITFLNKRICQMIEKLSKYYKTIYCIKKTSCATNT